uniref:Retrovirus-related Pol polyprotein from transposon TNT 1-94-like beta-barrel domain-containing protein n=1 Tax=Cajanus cajan TaxID=3821 RepID=A0A151SPU3_CAJCA|nr:hypothetical protein KK1_003105 [Cajanus cajan]
MRRKDQREGSLHKKWKSNIKFKLRCYICHRIGHYKRDYHEKGGKESKSFMDSLDVTVVSDGYESVGVLMTSTSKMQKNWVMDSGCTYHMCPVKDFFETLELKQSGLVLFGNNKA